VSTLSLSRDRKIIKTGVGAGEGGTERDREREKESKRSALALARALSLIINKQPPTGYTPLFVSYRIDGVRTPTRASACLACCTKKRAT
jgi:hypothetical protein